MQLRAEHVPKRSLKLPGIPFVNSPLIALLATFHFLEIVTQAFKIIWRHESGESVQQARWVLPLQP